MLSSLGVCKRCKQPSNRRLLQILTSGWWILSRWHSLLPSTIFSWHVWSRISPDTKWMSEISSICSSLDLMARPANLEQVAAVNRQPAESSRWFVSHVMSPCIPFCLWRWWTHLAGESQEWSWCCWNVGFQESCMGETKRRVFASDAPKACFRADKHIRPWASSCSACQAPAHAICRSTLVFSLHQKRVEMDGDVYNPLQQYILVLLGTHDKAASPILSFLKRLSHFSFRKASSGWCHLGFKLAAGLSALAGIRDL